MPWAKVSHFFPVTIIMISILHSVPFRTRSRGAPAAVCVPYAARAPRLHPILALLPLVLGASIHAAPRLPYMGARDDYVYSDYIHPA